MKIEDVTSISPLKLECGVNVYSPSMKSVSAFGLQWKEFSQVQLDSRNGLRISEERLRRIVGEDLNIFTGKLVLELGCGCGRFTEIMLKYGARVVCVDASIAIYECKNNIGARQDVLFVQGDILDLPFEEESFDFVVCLGVLQHTRKPARLIQKSFSFVKVGGTLIFDQYRVSLSTLMRTTWLIRPILKRLGPSQGIRVTNWLVDLFLPIHKKFAGKPLVEKLLFRVSPITSHYSSIPEMSENEQLQWARLNTHDNLTDWYKRLTWKRQLSRRIKGFGDYSSRIAVLPYTFEVSVNKIKGFGSRVEFSKRLRSGEVNSA